MTHPRPSRLADLVAPARGRPRYAPLTAGLLARKGEAAPASPFFSAEALGLTPTLGSGARFQLAAPEGEAGGHDDDHDREARETRMPWRARKPAEPLGGSEHEMREELLAAGGLAVHPPSTPATERAAPETRAALTLKLELEMLARLVLEARRRALDPARVIEAALAAHLPATGGACALCAHQRAEPAP